MGVILALGNNGVKILTGEDVREVMKIFPLPWEVVPLPSAWVPPGQRNITQKSEGIAEAGAIRRGNERYASKTCLTKAPGI